MNIKTIALIALCATNLLSYSQKNTVALTLTQKNGYGPFGSNSGGMSPYSNDENNPWRKTYLKASGVPKNLTDIKLGEIQTNIYQSVYQNYLLGNIPKESYEQIQKGWHWIPDTTSLSKEPLKCSIAFAYGTDATGSIKMVVDANNNLDFSDDILFTPVSFDPTKRISDDSLVLANSINVSFERFVYNKKTVANAPLYITYASESKMFFCNFSQYATTQFKGEEIAVSSDGFCNLSYEHPSIVLKSSVKEGEKAYTDNEVAKNEYIEIKGEMYKNMGVNLNKNTLILHKIIFPKNN